MSKTIPPQALVVVADGRKALFLRNEGTGGELSLREEDRLTPKDVADDGPSGSRPEDQTPKQTGEASFAKHLAESLFKLKEKGSYSELVLIADPQTLGQLRAAMHKNVEGSLVFTLSKDYTNHSLAEITKALG